MRRSLFLAAIVSLGVSLLAIAAYVAAKPLRERPTATVIYPKDAGDSLLWPNYHTSMWSINRMDDTKARDLTVVVRIKHEPLAKGQSVVIPVVSPAFSKVESDAEISLGTLKGVKADAVAFVSLQLIDLNEVGIAVDKRPLRLLLSLRVNGSTVWHKGPETAIEGDRVAGHSYHDEPIWKNGELHLKCIYVRTGERLACYDVLVLRTD
jgi:hypothetical protein